MMSLGAILELTGRLTDQSGTNTARERFRRFLKSDIPGLASVRALIAEAQESDDEQAQRALGDLVMTLGAGNVWQAGDKVLARLREGS